MKLSFYKYQGAGNDFVLIDNRAQKLQLNTNQIEQLCDRRFGIGSDGLMLLEEEDGVDFKMIYFNADGRESTMCGNGGRCITRFAKDLGIIHSIAKFIAIDGPHQAKVLDDGRVALGMIDVDSIIQDDPETILDTGSPHIVIPVDQLEAYDVARQGRMIRNQDRFGADGINVNFVESVNDELHIRTYERGVEDETLACGTGVTAAAIASVGQQLGSFSVPVYAKGGTLQVDFVKTKSDRAEQIVLLGPAIFVYQGEIEL